MVAVPVAAWVVGVVVMLSSVVGVVVGEPAPESAGGWSAARVGVWTAVACHVVGAVVGVIVGLRPPRWPRLVVVGVAANVVTLIGFAAFVGWVLATLRPNA